MLRAATLLVTCALFCVANSGASAQADRASLAIPPDLAPYRAWVLHGHGEALCPVRDGAPMCLWPGVLELVLDEQGGRFSLSVRNDGDDARVALPGGRGRYPLAVQVGRNQAPVVERADGTPTVLLGRGEHVISGRFQWNALPERLEVPSLVGLVDLRVLGQQVPFPKRDDSGQLWLQGSVVQDAQSDHLELAVFRKITDGVPLRITTQLALRIGGRARELSLGRVLLPGSVPLSLTSELPARIEEGGELRIQARAGTYAIEIEARLGLAREGADQALAFRAPASAGPWPEHEIWVFQADERLRQVELAGAPGIDPARTELPRAWHGLPTFELQAGQALALKTLRRGEPETPPNQATLRRELWLDLDGSHFTVRDQLETTLYDGFRLDLNAGVLGHAASNNEDLLITTRDKRIGVEVREHSQHLVAEWRLPAARDLPAVGWSEDVQSLHTTLHLGPGYRLLAARGVDHVSESWLTSWDLYDFFFVLVIALAALRLAGVPAALAALTTLVLSHQEPAAPYAVWLVLLGCIALLRVLPKGVLRNLVRAGAAATVVALATIAAPFAVAQVRAAIYPQLVHPHASSMRHRDEEAFMEVPALGGMAMPEEVMDEGMNAATLSPPAAPEPSSASVEQRVRKLYLEEDWSGSKRGSESRPKRALMQDPEAVVQTGPGVPSWTFQSWHLSWSGPVDKAHTLELFLLTPPWHRAVCVARVLALLALAYLLLRGLRLGEGKPGSIEPPSAANQAANHPASQALTCLALGAALSGALTANSARADIPAPELLDELRKRLTARDACTERCASIAELNIEARAVPGGEASLTLTLQAHALSATTLALPGPAASWIPARVLLDGRPAAVALFADGFLHVRVPEGVHTIEARGPLKATDTLTLSLLDGAMRASARGEGFAIDGVRPDGQLDASIQISRLSPSSEAESAPLEHSALPPYFQLHRRIELGPTWTVHNTLERISPTGTPLRVGVPLLAGEAVTSAGLQAQDGTLQVSLGRDENAVRWSSTLRTPPDGARIELLAADNKPWSERFSIVCGPMWHCLFSGVAPISRVVDGTYGPEFRPFPGERVAIEVSRPKSAGGTTITVDDVALDVTPGARMQRADLTLVVRTSRGTTHAVELPKGARIQTLTVDGTARPIRLEGGKLSVALEPGRRTIAVSWQTPEGIGIVQALPRVALERAASNARLALHVPEDRWLLWASGPLWGPAVLMWGYLLLVVLIAIGLARVPNSPLRFGQWALLGLGLTQVPALAALCVVAWFFALALRERTTTLPRFAHNSLQVALVALSVAALLSLLTAVQTGLLVQPDMQVAGKGSDGSNLHWYVDHVAQGALPSASVVSLPLWVFRSLMLLWSLWLARSVVRWLPWAYHCLRQGGAWRSRPARKRSAPTVPPAPPPISAPPPAVPPGQ